MGELSYMFLANYTGKLNLSHGSPAFPTLLLKVKPLKFCQNPTFGDVSFFRDTWYPLLGCRRSLRNRFGRPRDSQNIFLGFTAEFRQGYVQ